MVHLCRTRLKDIELWWPVGFGEQNMYTIRVEYQGESVTRKIGLRTIELDQSDIDDEQSYFFFKINGQEIFAKGANFIPIDVFESRVTDLDREYIIQTALQSNYNMIRVWGGGIYQPSHFYERCDEAGILVWQEFMFACSMYPRDTAYLKEVSLEVKQTALRLATHPSVVVFGGNNENEVAMDWFDESMVHRDIYVADYMKLYADTIFTSLQSVLGNDFIEKHRHVWVDSSPSNGLLSVDPYVKKWTRASTSEAGDMHFYDYFMDCENSDKYPTSRFVSEFGF